MFYVPKCVKANFGYAQAKLDFSNLQFTAL